MNDKQPNINVDKQKDISGMVIQLNDRFVSMANYMAEQFGKLSPSNKNLQNMPPFSENTEIIDEALAKAQDKFLDVGNSKKVGNLYKYANLADIRKAIKEALKEAAIAVVQPWEHHTNTSIYLATVLRCKGQWIKSGSIVDFSDLLESKNTGKKCEQLIGARITYFRKYQIQSMLFLYGEDIDDLQRIENEEKQGK